eukprot:1143412-Pelagomonas_calceolata.AAC.2
MAHASHDELVDPSLVFRLFKVLHQPHYQASTRNGGMLFARQDPSGKRSSLQGKSFQAVLSF